jgi:hypothetical protein
MIEHIDEHGKWIIDGNARMLIEPSQAWKDKNQAPPTEQKKELYKKRVRMLISQQFDIEDELAIIRKKSAGADTNEFRNYNDYVEQCKAQAKLELGLLEVEV